MFWQYRSKAMFQLLAYQKDKINKTKHSTQRALAKAITSSTEK